VLEKTLRVTLIIGCKRRVWFWKEGMRGLPPHYVALRGTDLHSMVDRFIYSGLEKAKRTAYYENLDKFNRFLDWFKRNGMNGRIAKVRRMYSELGFTGEIDFLVRKSHDIYDLYDVKSGDTKLLSFKSLPLQLGGYVVLLQEHRYLIDECYALLLGEKSGEVEYRVDPDVSGFLDHLEEARKAMVSVVVPPREKGGLCSFCSYRDICSEFEAEGI